MGACSSEVSKYLQSLVETKESERVEEIKLDDGV